MAFEFEHVLITAQGTLDGGEVWSCGVRSGAAGGPATQAGIQTMATAAVELWASYVKYTGFGVGANVALTQVQCRVVNIAGITQILAQAPPLAPTRGIVLAGASQHPNQVCACVSLETARAGRSGKGRFYLPACGVTIDTDGRMNAGQVASLAASTKTLLDGLNVLLAAGGVAFGKISVHSQKAPALAAEVTAVRIGNVADTQRRRRDALPEVYSGAAIA